MGFEIRKQKQETNQSLIRRFTKRIKESGILSKTRETLFYVRKKSEEAKKRSTLRRLEKKAEYEKLVKLGKIQNGTQRDSS